jgi:hypothetical protein
MAENIKNILIVIGGGAVAAGVIGGIGALILSKLKPGDVP